MTVENPVFPDDVTSVVGWNNVPEVIRALSPLPSTSYVDLFTLRTDIEALPLEWASAIIEDAAGAGGQVIWRSLLGLRLAPRMPDTVGGWVVAEHGEEWIRLEARSRCLTCHVAIRTDHGCVSLATFVAYDQPFGRVLWTPASAAHRRLVPGLLRQAAALLRDHDESSR